MLERQAYPAQGYFLPPTVVTGMDVSTSPLMREEIFGPIVCVAPFDDDAEAVALANDCEYGLSASLWSRDVCRVHCTAQKLQVIATYRTILCVVNVELIVAALCRRAQCGATAGWCANSICPSVA